MLGNSYTYFNDMPQMVKELTGAYVVQHTRGGAYLDEQIDPNSEMGAKTLRALKDEKWDYVVLQEYSNGAFTAEERFIHATDVLCQKIYENGAKPVFYLTWAYQKDGAKLAYEGFDYTEMYNALQKAYRKVAAKNNALLADVGTAFYENSPKINLYNEDGTHPNEEGSRLAAKIIADVILNDYKSV